jgi:hypothetical protein
MKSFSEFKSPKIEDIKLDLPTISELTVSPYYTQRGVANPYYDLDISMDAITAQVGEGDIKFKNVESASGQEIFSVGNGKFFSK